MYNIIFCSFTPSEVESIRSVVMCGQQNDDMLLTNSTKRPLDETRAFIKKFKKSLLDIQISAEEISRMANQQYVAIITSSRVKKGPTLSTTFSMNNLNSTTIMPLKFRGKLSKYDVDSDSSNGNSVTSYSTRSQVPTRSRSVNNLTLEGSKPRFHMIDHSFDTGVPTINKQRMSLQPGSLVLVLDGSSRTYGKIICFRESNGKEFALVAFFEEKMEPKYFSVNLLVNPKSMVDLSEDLTVDKILLYIIVKARSILNNVLYASAYKNHKGISKLCLPQSIILQFLSFSFQWIIPPDKFRLLYDEILRLTRPNYETAKIISERCNLMVDEILKYR